MPVSKIEKKLLHYTAKAISDYNMIQHGDRVMLCLSGGKDSFTLLTLLNKLRIRSHNKFELFSYTLDQSQPGWDDSGLRTWLAAQKIPHFIETRDTYSIVIDKVQAGKSYCSMCSRLRRGNIYRYASDNGFNKIALGHHRDDLIESTLMSMLYSGEIRSMPPKLLTDSKRHIVIRPLALCQEQDIAAYAEEQQYPIIPCNLCGSQKNMTRAKVKQLISDLATDNPNVPGNLLNALGNVQLSQMMDQNHHDFVNLESQLNFKSPNNLKPSFRRRAESSDRPAQEPLDPGLRRNDEQ